MTLGRYLGCAYINEGKSAVHCGEMADNVKQEILEICMMREEQLRVRYLGVSLHHRSFTKADYNPLVMKLKQTISNWAMRHLSYVGRLVLINLVLFSMIIRFWASLFVFPVGLVEELKVPVSMIPMVRGLEKGSHAKVAWEDINQPKECGGLGIKEILAWNHSMIANWICELDTRQHNSVWHSWVYAYKLQTRGLWEVQARPNDSIWWKRMPSVRDMVVEKLSAVERQQLCGKQRRERGQIPYDLFWPEFE